MRIDKRLKPVYDYARRQGFSVAVTKNMHLKFSRPGTQTVYTPSTPSDHRASHNAMAQLKRAVRDANR